MSIFFVDMEDDYEDIAYYEDDEDMQEVDEACYDEPAPTATEKLYEVLTPTALLERQQQEVAQIKEVFEVSPAFASILLRFFQWNVEDLMNKFFDYGRNKVFEAAGVVDEDKSILDGEATLFECSCCFDDSVEFADTTSLNCGHRFCNNCWSQHVCTRINEGQSKQISCMQRGCNVVFDESRVPSFVSGRAFEKYKMLLLEAYVEDNQKVKWCPSVPHCSNAVFVASSSPKLVVNVTCTCGHEYCFNCCEEPHGPATCGMVRLWKKKLQTDSENTTWLSQNTKDCPLCGKPVEKNGGCNLMACRCGSFFCWICGQSTGSDHTWADIKGHTCGKYKENFDADNAKTQLQRFQHYHERFKANADSYRLELRMVDSLDSCIECLQKLGDGSLSSWDWLFEGLHTLRVCRRVLQWSYTWVYYSFNPCNVGPTSEFCLRLGYQDRQVAKHMFEDTQEQLEYLTERLSKELETPINLTTAEEVGKLKSTVLDMSRVALKRCRGIFDVLEKDVLKEDYIEFK